MAVSFPKDKIQVALLEGIHQNAVDYFKRHGYNNVLHYPKALPSDELRDVVSKAHMVGIRSRTKLTADVLSGAEKLMAIGCFCIGTNQVALDAAMQKGIPVFNAPHSNTRSVAEMILAELVMLMRGLGDKNTAAHEGRWLKSAANSFELRGKSLGIVGYGHIGSQVSILAEAFGMTVFYYDIETKLAMGNAMQVPSFEQLLETCDAISFHVPETPLTKNMMDEKHINMMKQGAYLLNASRGTVVDIEALASALKDGRLLGAAVDVFPVEPKSNEDEFVSPLRGLTNVILTPHIGGSTQEAQENIGTEVATKLVQYSDAGSTIGSVNFPNISLSPHAGAHRFLHIHKNQPGVLGAINKALADSHANIVGQHLQTNNEVGYVVIDLEREHNPDLHKRLCAIEGTIRCRILY